MKKARAKAKVRITVEVSVGAWGFDSDLQQVFDQAATSGKERVASVLHANTDIRMIGEPVVIGIITEQE